MSKYSIWVNYFILLLGLVAFILAMYESFYPHGQAFTYCFNPYDIGSHPKQNPFTIIMGSISFLLLSYVGYQFFIRLPSLKKEESGFKFLADSNDIGPHL